MKQFRELWRNRETAYRLLTWFRNIARQSADRRATLQALTDSVAAGDLDDLVASTKDVDARRRGYLNHGE